MYVCLIKKNVLEYIKFEIRKDNRYDRFVWLFDIIFKYILIKINFNIQQN